MVAFIIGRQLNHFFDNPLIRRGSNVLQDQSVKNLDLLNLFDLLAFFDDGDIALLRYGLIPEDVFLAARGSDKFENLVIGGGYSLHRMNPSPAKDGIVRAQHIYHDEVHIHHLGTRSDRQCDLPQWPHRRSVESNERYFGWMEVFGWDLESIHLFNQMESSLV